MLAGGGGARAQPTRVREVSFLGPRDNAAAPPGRARRRARRARTRARPALAPPEQDVSPTSSSRASASLRRARARARLRADARAARGCPAGVDEIDAMDVTDGGRRPPRATTARPRRRARSSRAPAAKLAFKLAQCHAAYRERNEPLARLPRGRRRARGERADAQGRVGPRVRRARANGRRARRPRSWRASTPRSPTPRTTTTRSMTTTTKMTRAIEPAAVPIHDAAPVGRECV